MRLEVQTRARVVHLKDLQGYTGKAMGRRVSVTIKSFVVKYSIHTDKKSNTSLRSPSVHTHTQ